MQKLTRLLGAVMVLCAVASAEVKSGSFIGVSVGAPINNPSYQGANLQSLSDYLPSGGAGWGFGLEIGHRHMLNNRLGVRYYADYFYGQYKSSERGEMGFVALTTEANIVQHHISVNFDVLLYLTQRFGVYVGVGVGYQIYEPLYTFNGHKNFTGGVGTGVGTLSIPTNGAQRGLAIPVNIGMMWNVGENSQITFGAKVSTKGYEYGLQDGERISLGAYIIKLGYNYTF